MLCEGPYIALSVLPNTVSKLWVTYLLLCGLYKVPELILSLIRKVLRWPTQVGVSIRATFLSYIFSHKHTVGRTLAGCMVGTAPNIAHRTFAAKSIFG